MPGEDGGLFEFLLVLAGGGVGAWGAYKLSVRLVGIAVVLLALGVLAIHWLPG